MSQNSTVAPAGNHASRQSSPVKKPWARWLIVVWMLLTFGVLANALGAFIAQKSGGGIQLARGVSVSLLVVVFWLVFGVVTLRKRLVVASATILGLIAVLVIVNSVYLVVHGAPLMAALKVTLICSVPSLMAAWYLSRRSFLDLAASYRSWLSQVKGQKLLQ